MPLSPSDIKLRLSTKAGGVTAGNQAAQADVNQSLGKYMATTEITDAVLNNLFNDWSGDENAAQVAKHRVVFIHNSGAQSWTNARVWISGYRSSVSSGASTFASTAHGLQNGMQVRIEAEKLGDTVPGGFNNSTTYWVVGATANTFQLSATEGGSAITASAAGLVAVRKFFGCVEAIALSATGAVAHNSASAQAEVLADENDSTNQLSALTFASPTTKAAGLNVGTLAAGQVIGIILKATAQNNGAFNNDGFLIRVQGDSAA